MKLFEILLVEDNPGDARLTREALTMGKVHNNLSWVKDGKEAMMFLHREGRYENAQRPDVIFLDLNLPGYTGQEILEIIKKDENLKLIPVIILTSSQSEVDICKSYAQHANCYISKPVNLDKFISVIKTIDTFWLNIVQLPPTL